jgi:hypothetical protein
MFRPGEPNTYSRPAGWRAALVADRGNRSLPPASLPKLDLPAFDDRAERREAADKFAEYRIVAKGRDAWASIDKAESFEGWKAIGAALSVGKAHALKVSGANQAWGRNYSREFSDWIKQHFRADAGLDAERGRRVARTR